MVPIASMGKYDEMWRMLGENQFRGDSEMFFEVMCVICNDLLIDACQGPCGCKYCTKCVTVYLQNGDKRCPGNTDDCLVDLCRDNIRKDNAANRSVSKQEVNCPSESCNYRTKIMLMCDHLRLCNKKSIPCPFVEIGCDAVSVTRETMSDHLLSAISNHTHQIIEWMMNLKNEMLSSGTKQPEMSKHKLQQLTELIDNQLSRDSIDTASTDKTQVEIISVFSFISCSDHNELLIFHCCS